MPNKTDRAWPALSAILISAYFLWFTRGALTSYFSPDDVTNLYRAWSYPLKTLIRANVLFFLNSSFFRPFTSAWYRFIFYFVGFNPVPFHAVNLLILAANIWLTYCVVRRLTKSQEAGAVAALLIAYIPNCGPLYFDTGFVFDVQCYCFYFSAFLLYLRIRQQDRALRAWELAACALLFVLALGSKELAVTLPAPLLLYELLYVGIPWRSPRQLARWLFRDGLPVSVTSCIAVLFAAGRLLDHSQPTLMTMDAYRPVFTWDRWMTTSADFMGELFLQNHPLGRGAVLAIWLVLLAAAVAMRSRALQFAWLFLILSPIPVAFIPPRGAPQYYVAIFGWVLYAAVVFVRSIEFILDRLPASLQLNPPEARGPAMVLVCAALLFPFYRNTGWTTTASVAEEGEFLRDVVTQLQTLRPQVKPAAHILFLNDPVDDDYRLLFLERLLHDDVGIIVERARNMAKPPGPDEIAQADVVFDYRHGRFFDSPQPPPQGPEPAIQFEWGRPAVYHQKGFAGITRWSPAKPGEGIIAKVTDLGPTDPPVAAGQPFPGDPLLNVAAPLEVRVGGVVTKVAIKIGWPGLVNSYRIDFTVPESAGHGNVPVQVIVNGVAGPEVDIPVE